MTSQPEDKIAAILQQAYNQTYQESFGTQPPRGGQNSPSSHPEERGTRRLEEGRVDSHDIQGEEDTHRDHGERVGAVGREEVGGESMKSEEGEREDQSKELPAKLEEKLEVGGTGGLPSISKPAAGSGNVTSTIPPTTTTTTSTHTPGTTDERQDVQSPQRPTNQDQDRETKEGPEEEFTMPGSYPGSGPRDESSPEPYSDEDQDEYSAEDEDAQGEAEAESEPDSEGGSEGEYEHASDDGRTTVSSLEDIAALISQDSGKHTIPSV